MYNGIYNKEQYAYVYDTLVKWLSARIQGGGLGEALLGKGAGKVAVYGVNGLGELAYQDIKASGVEIICFVDKNAGGCGLKKDGLEVLGLGQLGRLPEDSYILVTPEYYFYEIMMDLSGRGVPLERIISLSMLV